jgi:hypothetical protein
MSHPFDLRMLEHGDVEIRRFFSLIIESQEWSDFLHILSLPLWLQRVKRKS